MNGMFVSGPGVPKAKSGFFTKEEHVNTTEDPKEKTALEQLDGHRDMLIKRFGDDYQNHPLFQESVQQLIGGRAFQSVLLDLKGY